MVTNWFPSGFFAIFTRKGDDIYEKILERLKNKGYKVVSVGELIYDSDYYIDNLGIQRKN